MKRLLILALGMLAFTGCQDSEDITVDALGNNTVADRFIEYYLDEYNDDFSAGVSISKGLDKYVIGISFLNSEYWISGSSDEYEAIAEASGDVAIEDHYTLKVIATNNC